MFVQGEVRQVRPTEDGKYVDIAILEEGAVSSLRTWAFRDAPGVAALEVGQVITARVYPQAKTSKAGKAYLSTQLHEVYLEEHTLKAVNA